MKALFIQLKQIGDVLMTTPAVRAFKKKYPQATLHFLVNGHCSPAVRNNPFVDKTIIADARFFLRTWLWLFRERYDVVVDFMGTPRTARLAFFSGAKTRIGMKKMGRSFFYNRHVEQPAEDTYAALGKFAFLEPLGIHDGPAVVEFYIDGRARQEGEAIWNRLAAPRKSVVVAFSPVSRRQYKIWPPKNFAQACDALIAQTGCVFLPLFGPGEEKTVESVINLSRNKQAFLYPYRAPSFSALKFLIEQCRMYFGNDNGIRHVAVSCGLPTATVFGPPNPLTWTPREGIHEFIRGKDDIASIGPEQAIEMALKVFHKAKRT